jgi:chromosomal replication initiation ATPase DnaA
MPDATVWDEVLRYVRTRVEAEDFRRWFGDTSYASDAGDQITVWVTTEAIRRHLMLHFGDDIHDALSAVGRAGTHVRFIVTGVGDDEDEDEDEA